MSVDREAQELGDETRAAANASTKPWEAGAAAAADAPGPPAADLQATRPSAPRDTALRHDDWIEAARAQGRAATEAAEPPRNWLVGYDILRELHRGGQGVVYLAIQKSTNRKVALKVLREGVFAGANDRARFEREVRILGALNHPNIVTVYDSGNAQGMCYYVMDYIQGKPLDQYVQTRWPAAEDSQKRLPSGSRTNEPRSQTSRRSSVRRDRSAVADLLRLFVKICDAVNVAHLRGIIHRDLKPGNIVVDPSGEPHVLDFGLAKVSDCDDLAVAAGAMTETGQFVGSLPWASPEQAEGRPSWIDLRTDVYSLGVILYQMLTGQFPYDVAGSVRDVLDRIMRAEPLRPSRLRRGIDNDVETIVLKCLHKERERRYQSAGELARDIRHRLAGEPIEAKRDSSLYWLRKMASRNKKATIAVLAAVTTLFSWGYISAWLYRGQAEALRRQAVSDAVATQRQERLQELVRGELTTSVRRYALGWFLLEWQAGRVDRARQIAEKIVANSSERKAAEFVLDEAQTLERLLASLPQTDEGLAYFVAGERLLKAGQSAEAAAMYKRCIETSADTWWRDSARARCDALAAGAAAKGQ